MNFKTIILTILLLFACNGTTLAQDVSFKKGIVNQLFLDEPLVYFVEVEPFEVRVEITVEVATLIDLLKFPVDNGTLSIVEQTDLKKRAAVYFEDYTIFSLAGIPSAPSNSKASFLKIGDENSVIKEESVEEPIDEAVLGISYVFSSAKIVDFFQLALLELPGNTTRIPVQVQALNKTQQFEFSDFSLNIDWSLQGLKFQMPEILPVQIKNKSWFGNAKLDTKAAPLVIEKLLRNIYNAFEYINESMIYDKLAISVSGEQLTSLFLDQKKRMEAVNRGGARVKVLDLKVVKVYGLKKLGDSFVMTARWDVTGKVTHFGHTHERKNHYMANITVTPSKDHWKISDIIVLDESRVK